MSSFWDKFYEKQLDQIPWQNTQADWFKELVDNGIVRGETALDLGCGTGVKSIYLVQRAGFKKVLGIDVAKRAIELAKHNSKATGTENACTFIRHDVVDWSYLHNGEEFDFILDWATLHTLPPEKRDQYMKGVQCHCRQGGLFLIRAFSSDSFEEYFEEKNEDIKERVYFFTKDKIVSLLPEFKLLKENRSTPKTKPNMFFIELLFKKE